MGSRDTTKFFIEGEGGGPEEPRPCLTVWEGPEVGREYALPPGESFLGRAAECDHSINEGSVSKRHLRILVTPGSECLIEDLDSTNGTLVNGRATERATLQDGDEVRLGSCLLKFAYKSPGTIRYTRRLYVMATRDPLTDLLNRRSFEERLQHHWDLADREGTPLAILMADIDRFKSINDTWGHDRGDQILRSVATALREGVRRPDLVARWGGEEFVILLVGDGAEEALQTAERLRGAIAGLDHADPGPERVTISIGIASRSEVLEDPQRLLEAADAALYRAKDEGRNCCRPAESEPSG